MTVNGLVTGYLSVWMSPFSLNAISQIKQKHPNVKLLPYQMDAQEDHAGQNNAFLMIAGFVGFFGVVMLAASWMIATPPKPTKEIAAPRPAW
jgi:hypothetical protein